MSGHFVSTQTVLSTRHEAYADSTCTRQTGCFDWTTASRDKPETKRTVIHSLVIAQLG